jgi:pyrroline-5-carboxylate reductase
MRLGFLGAGAITSAMVRGLCEAGTALYEIRLSPRNAAVAAELAAQFPQVTVAASNQEMVDQSEAVVIAVRPQIAATVLRELRFRPEQNIISLVSGHPVGKLAVLVAPATKITRAVPLPAAARRLSPTAIYPRDAYPDNPVAAELFAALGTVSELETEHEFDVMCTATATMAPYYAFADCIASWLVNHGIPKTKARDYVAHLLNGLADTTLRSPQRSFRELAAGHATRGGTNEQVLRHLTDHGVFEAYSAALDAILVRVTAASR